jgi:hypothetical protein
MMGEGFGEAATPFVETNRPTVVYCILDSIPARRKEKPTVALLLFYLLGHPFRKKDRTFIVAFFSFFFTTFA